MSYTGRGEGHYQLYLLRQTQPPLLAIYKHTSSGFLIGQFRTLGQWLLKLVQYYKSIERRLAGYFVRFTQFVTNENKQIHYCVQRLRETTCLGL